MRSWDERLWRSQRLTGALGRVSTGGTVGRFRYLLYVKLRKKVVWPIVYIWVTCPKVVHFRTEASYVGSHVSQTWLSSWLVLAFMIEPIPGRGSFSRPGFLEAISWRFVTGHCRC
jgi:hypothetical protein